MLLDKIVHELRSKICKDQFETWFRGFKIDRVDQHEILFSVPNGFLRDWITRNYTETLERAVSRVVSGSPRIRICLSNTQDTGAANGGSPATTPPPVAVSTEPPAPREGVVGPTQPERVPAEPVARVEPQPAAQPEPVTESTTGSTTTDDAWLNSNYTFEEFVVGPCNRLAHAAALAIGANPGRAYNPFFVHGKVGLGKTHLLQAICHAILRAQPNSRVLFLSCEEFTNRFIDSIQNRTLSQFPRLPPQR